LRSDIRLLSRAKDFTLAKKSAHDTPTISSRRIDVRSSSRRKRR
jgi:hypothetical protein